ncbi:MAG: GH116 family glycosyl-hydrolase [Acutalibacteraceae bacterium]
MLYSGKKLKEIIFPLGGIGTGSIGLAGNGSLVDWEIFNRPNKGSINGHSFFVVKAQYPDGKSVCKILQGDHIKDLMGQYSKTRFGGYGFGPKGATMCGFPHFQKMKFDGKFPIATLTFEDENFPAKVILKAFNPFIPLDADNSGIPAAFFEIKIKSLAENIRYSVILSVNNPFESSKNHKLKHEKYTAIQMLHHGKAADEKEYGDMTIAVDCKDGVYQEYWYRGGWQDKVTTFWRDLTDGHFNNRRYSDAAKGDVCSVGAEALLNAGQSKAFHFVLSWNIPNNYNYWNPCKDKDGNDILWKNYYAKLFADSAASCFYCLDNWDTLYKKTNRFCKSLHSSTLDKSVLDAVSSTLSVLKSPTVMRLEDGTFYGWEGVHEHEGSCEGTCTHVWSYAYALCFLFPELERSLRNTEFQYDTDAHGRMYFRTALPLGRGYVTQPPCVDGQMATVVKIYRDWKLTGNNAWLKENWDNTKKILEYAWSDHNPYEWDKDKDGVLEGRQHHTLDMELFGPSSWLQGMYLCALKAAAEMADFLGDADKKAEYTALFEKGRKWTKENLFNGRYFFQKVELDHKAYTEHFDCPNYWNEEKGQLKYQIGDGCEIDQLLGQWHANICGLGDIFDKAQRQTALRSMLKNNFKSSLRDVANMWRVFALNDESGAVMCDYPDGCDKPVIPIPYCDECMTGFEYAFAGLLISEGLVEEGLNVVRAVRNRYDGEKRNPWNEIECGSNYARPMASFALLPIFSGFAFDVPKKHIGFSPILSGDFKCLWSMGTGWGEFIKTEKQYTIVIASGSLALKSITLGGIGEVKSICVDGRKIPFTQEKSNLFFEDIQVKKELRVDLQ